MSSPYSENAYRLLGLLAGARRTSVLEAQQTLKVRAKAGRLGSSSDLLSPFDPLRQNDSTVRDAFNRLETSHRRIREWLFWFEGSGEVNGEISSVFSSGDARGARDLWAASGDAISRANVARLSHAEIISSDPRMEDVRSWTTVFRAWIEALSGDGLWSRLLESEASSGFEPSATVSEISELREAAWELVLEPSLSLVREGAESEAGSRGKRHMEALRAAGWPAHRLEALEAGLSAGLESDVHRLAEAIEEELEKQLPAYENPDDKSSAEMSGAKESCDKAVAAFRQRVSPLIGKLKSFGQGPALQRSRDRIARLLRSVAITYANDAKEYDQAEVLLVEADGLVSETATNERVRKDLEVIRSNIKEREFWAKATQTIPPALATINGIGTVLYGKTDKDPEYGSYVATRYFVFMYIPLHPVDRYRVIPLGSGVYRFVSQEPLKTFHHVYRRVVLCLMTAAVSAALFFGVFLWTLRRPASRSSPPLSPAAAPLAPAVPASAPAALMPPKLEAAPTTKPKEKSAPVSKPAALPTSKPTPLASGNQRAKSPPRDRGSLLGSIEANKQSLAERKKRIASLNADITSADNELTRVKAEIDEMKERKKVGWEVDPSSYGKKVDKHNTLADFYNEQSAKLKKEVAEYKAELSETNRMIDEYNGEIGRK